MISITEIKLTLDEALTKETERKTLLKKISVKYRFPIEDIKEFYIRKKAIDARNKSAIFFVYNVDISSKKESSLLALNDPHIKPAKKLEYEDIPSGTLKLKHRPVIIGFGPSGLFASYILAKRGYKPIVLEQGLDVVSRHKELQKFIKTREFNEKASILYGEGGAGTYSDGKLTTLVNDIRSQVILETFVACGAPEEIMYLNKAHIGTDVLTKVVYNMRKEIERLGGDIRFSSKVTNFIIKDNKIIRLEVNSKEIIDTSICLIGIGHSSKDTVKKLYEQKMELSQKPFSIGVRIEHPQTMINKSQYGRFFDHPSLGAADYKLSYHSPSGRSAYTFCMCPGGTVMPSNSEAGTIVTNGMSESLRNKENANSALLVNVLPSDFGSPHPLAGFEFQYQFEKQAFIQAGANYNAPIQKVGDFLENKKSKTIGEVKPSYLPGTTFCELNKILPDYVISTLKEALVHFDRRIQGFKMDDAILTGVETRSSSPVRMNRDEFHQSNIKGIYPMGEGAGYSGGIMSSAIDGIKTAEQVISRYKELT